MKIVIITGCLGLIGSHITRKCLSKGWKVLGIDSQTYASNESFLNEFLSYENFSYLKKDICDVDYLPDCDYVINTAAETHVGNSIINANSFIKSNIIGVQNLLDLIKNKPTNVDSRPVFIHFSTDEVYGESMLENEELKKTEESILCPTNPYAATKAGAELIAQSYFHSFKIPIIIFFAVIFNAANKFNPF